jgi:NADP-dependent 3-hydroxy acid dehydrogenase YdfG
MENGVQAVSKLNKEGLQNIEAIEIDISEKTFIEKARNTIGNKTGVLDILINNAGIREA